MRVAILQAHLAPYRVPLYERLRERLTSLRVFLSAPGDLYRNWGDEWGSLDVVAQRNFTMRRSSHDSLGFTWLHSFHFPYDTIPLLWRYRPDAIISEELGLRTLQAVLYKRLRPSTRLLIWCKLSEHTERGWGRIRLMLRRYMLARADGIIVNGESGARYIARFGVPNSRILRVNQPVDVSKFGAVARERPAGAGSRLLICGSLIARKGVVPFLRQLDGWSRRHPQSNIELWWVGGGPLQAELEKFACPPNLTQRFLGEVPYAEQPSWYNQADILVFPTLLDEWGMVVNEALAAGLPIMGSVYAQAVTELIEDGVTGWTFDPADEASVQRTLDRVFETPPGKLAAMREAARRRIAEVTPDAAAKRVFEFLCNASPTAESLPPRDEQKLRAAMPRAAAGSGSE